MGWFTRMLNRRGYRVSVDEARSCFVYRERGRSVRVSGEAMADGYAVYSSSIVEWEPTGGQPIDDAERMRIATNIRSYLTERGRSVYLA